jgi:hypothetical protein
MFTFNYLIVTFKVVIIVSALILFGCEKNDNPIEPDDGDYTLTVKYDSIRSYPGGGGIFVASLKVNPDFTGKVKLTLQCDNNLNATLTETELDAADSVFNIILAPMTTIKTGRYSIKIISSHNGAEKTKELSVEIYYWSGNFDDAKTRLTEFRQWVEHNKPQYSSLFIGNPRIYSTYPQTLIVEHYTFLNDFYEMRMCYHVMIPPYDWSKLCIRRLDKTEPELALMRDTNGDITIIPVGDYPSLYGY